MNTLRKWIYYSWSVVEMIIGFKNWWIIPRLFFRINQSSSSVLKLRIMPLNICVRSFMDVWSVKECFLDRFYTKHGTIIENDWNIIDIGAAIGEFTLLAAHEAPNGHVFAFEPNLESFHLLEENISLNKLTNIECINTGVWSRKGQISLDLSGSEPLKAQSTDACISKDNLSVISVTTLEEVIKEIVKQPVDLIKLDCEGAEFEILLSTTDESMQKIARIIMEYHDFEKVNRHHLLVSFLEKSGFSVMTFPNPVHSELGYLYASREILEEAL